MSGITNFEINNNVKSICIYGKTCKDKEYDLDIVIPTYKRKDLLLETIRSINNQIPTRKLKWHVMVVSNDPEFQIDDIMPLINDENYSVYVNTSNLGMVGNINRCALVSKAKYVAYIQDDDILLCNYLIEIEKLFISDKLKNIDCLILNRLLYIDKNDDNEQYGKRSIITEQIKSIFGKITFKKKANLLERIQYVQCAEILFNGFGGGPTCGMLFEREKLLLTAGFSYEYPYAFDQAFFIENSDKLNVFLFDKYLSIYRLTDGASRNPKVLYDFYRCDNYLVEQSVSKSRFVACYKNEILRYSYDKKPEDTQRMIDVVPNIEKSKYFKYKILKFWKMTRSSIYRRKIIYDIKNITIDV